MNNMKIKAAVLSLALMLPAASMFASTHYYYRNGHRVYYTTYRHHRHHYSQARGAAIGAVAGAIVDRRHPLTGAIIGAAVGEGVQAVRNHNVKH